MFSSSKPLFKMTRLLVNWVELIGLVGNNAVTVAVMEMNHDRANNEVGLDSPRIPSRLDSSHCVNGCNMNAREIRHSAWNRSSSISAMKKWQILLEKKKTLEKQTKASLDIRPEDRLRHLFLRIGKKTTAGIPKERNNNNSNEIRTARNERRMVGGKMGRAHI